MHAKQIALLAAGILLSLPALSEGPAQTTAETTVTQRPQAISQQLQKALDNKGESYRPRTEHLDGAGKPLFTNRLILQDSPYLLQHAHNPVDWYGWGEQAFAAAKAQDKPIFLSIGYSTCHWCHVMERESFEDLEIANYLNEHFIAIKVDRELRPDIDASYMNAVMLIAGRGGWPMSSFLTSDGRTFHGGTYFPPDHFLQLLGSVEQAWHTQQPQIFEQATAISAAVAQMSAASEQALAIGPETLDQATTAILARFDDFQGGFSQAPKFPNEPLLFLLLNQLQRAPDAAIQEAVESTLDAMAQGGIYDQIAGGFHRYSTDNAWLVPHFEKMLYNQAHLSRIYLQAWQLTAKPEYQRVVRQTLDYVLREMTAETGGFYSATDADSEGEEGLFFLWTEREISSALPEDEAALMLDLYQITEHGNFENSNILSRAGSLEHYAEQNNLDPQLLIDRVAANNASLWQSRQSRIAPLRDDKILSAWNGMMISSFALAGELLGEPRYTAAATRAADFIWATHYDGETQQLARASLEGKASVAASQEDYAYLAESYLMLYDSSGDKRWLKRAQALNSTLQRDFWDRENGGYYMSAENNTLTPMGRSKSSADSAIPSGNSVALHLLQKLNRRSESFEHEAQANKLIAARSASIAEHPSAYAYLLSAIADMQLGEMGPTQYAAKGHVAVRSTLDEHNTLRVQLSVDEGWHVNADKPLQDYLIATTLKSAGNGESTSLNTVRYPQPVLKKLGFQRETLALFEADIEITSPHFKHAERAELRLQACSDKVCLAPETVKLSVFKRPAKSSPE